MSGYRIPPHCITLHATVVHTTPSTTICWHRNQDTTMLHHGCLPTGIHACNVYTNACLLKSHTTYTYGQSCTQAPMNMAHVHIHVDMHTLPMHEAHHTYLHTEYAHLPKHGHPFDTHPHHVISNHHATNTMSSHIIPCHAIKSCHVLHQIMPCHILPCSATQYHYILCVRRAQAAKKTLADAGPYRRQGDTETDKERTLETRSNMYQSDRHRCRSVGDVSGHVLMYPDRHRYNMYY